MTNQEIAANALEASRRYLSIITKLHQDLIKDNRRLLVEEVIKNNKLND